MTTPNRRDFLKTVAVTGAATGAGFLPRRTFAQSKKGNKLAFRTLGSTGQKVTEVGFGAMNMRDTELVQVGLDAGINYFDTAFGYMNGVNETTVGKVLKPVRNKVFITTKVPPAKPGDMMRMMETSLKRLQTDHVDLMLLHAMNARKGTLHPDFMKVIDEARKKGMTRFIGVSTHENHAEVMDAAVESKLWEVVLVGYNYMSPPSVKAAIARTRKAGLGIVAMKTFLNPIDLATWNWEQIRDIRKDKQSKVTPIQALLKWVLDDPNVDTTVPGVTSFEQLEEDVAVMGLKMSFIDRRELSRYAEAVESEGGYCRGVAGCTGCEGQCPHNVSIRELNRCVRYAHGYGDPGLARENHDLLPVHRQIAACSNCEECVVKCVHGLDLTAMTKEAKALFG
ncbi:MAG: aldo/keto reductase [Candidatus Latescibacterota bacterium]